MVRRLAAGCATVLTVAAVLLVLLWLSHPWWLSRIGGYLVLNQSPVVSDAVVAVSGDHSRRRWAISLYQQGVAGLLIFNLSDTSYVFGLRMDPLSSVRQLAAYHHIPLDSIIINTDISSTWEDALATRETVKRLGLNSIVVVSSPFNMRRVYLTYRHLFSGLPVRMRFCSVPLENEKLSLENWWKRERELQLVVNEYLKIIFYYFKYFL